MSNLRVPPSFLGRYFESAFIVDEDDVGQLVITETSTAGDEIVTIRGKYKGTTTPDADVLEVPLPWTVADGSMWAIEIIATAKGTGIRRRIKVSAIVYGASGTAHLDDDPEVDEAGTGNATATLTVAAQTMVIALDPVDATPLHWGFEVRGQVL